MNETFFKICCPSCETVFEVTDPELIGQIVACPKCGGMILVEDQNGQNALANGDVEGEEIASKSSVEPNVGSDVSGQIAPPVVDLAVQRVDVLHCDSDRSEELESISEDADGDVSKSSRYIKAVLILSGFICALLFIILWQVWGNAGRNESDKELPTQIVQTEKENELTSVESETADVSAVEDEETNEADETDVDDMEELTLTRNESFDSNEEFDPSEAIEIAGEEGLTEPENDEAVSDESDGIGSTDDEERSDTEALTFDSDDEDAGESPSEIDGDTNGGDKPANESGSKTADEVDDSEESASDNSDAMTTDFDEEKFEEANKNSETVDEDEEMDLGSVASTTDVTIKTAFPSLKLAPKEINVEERLQLNVREIVFPNSPADAVRLLSEFSGVPIEFDLTSFELIRESVESTLDLSLTNVDVGTALESVADLLKWKISTEKNRVVISSSDNLKDLIEERFEVSDLLETELNKSLIYCQEDKELLDSSPNVLLELFVKTLVSPEAWGNENVGQGSVQCDGTSLVVKHNALERRRVGDLLERLRALHGLEAKGTVPSNTLIAETLGWERLNKKIAFNLLEPTTLQQAVEILENTQKIRVLWDDSVLNDFGAGRDSTTFAKIDEASIDQTLFDLLEPLKLTYIILDENLFLITTKEHAKSYKTVEIHLFSKELAELSEEDARNLALEMKTVVDPKGWEEDDVALWIDLQSGCWLIRQTQPNQRAIRNWLEGRQKQSKSGN